MDGSQLGRGDWCTNSLAGEWVNGPNSDEGTDTVVVLIYWYPWYVLCGLCKATQPVGARKRQSLAFLVVFYVYHNNGSFIVAVDGWFR